MMIRNRQARMVAAATAAQLLLLLALGSAVRGQTPATAASGTGESQNTGGELQQVTVTGYLIPHVGDGPQPVTSYDQTYITKTGDPQVAAVLHMLRAATGNVN